MAITISENRSRASHAERQRNLAIAKPMRCVTGLRRCAFRSHLVVRAYRLPTSYLRRIPIDGL